MCGTPVFSRLLWQLETSMYMAKIDSSIFLQHSHVLYLLILLPLGWQSEVTHSNTSFSEDLLGACCQNKFLLSMNDSIFLYICINKPLYLICLSEYFYMHKEATIVSACPATAMVTTIRHNHNLDMIYRSTIACQRALCFFTIMHLPCVRTSLQCALVFVVRFLG